MADYDKISDDGKVTLSNDELSDADTSDSGNSTDLGLVTNRMVTAAKERHATTISALPRASAMCTMCDVAGSEFICKQCGGLSFCLKCAVSLHDNKFLGTHKIESLLSMEGSVSTIAELKIRLHKPTLPEAFKAPPLNLDPVVADGAWRKGAKLYDAQSNMNSVHTVAAKEPQVDPAELAADRQLLVARARELKGAADTLKKLTQSATSEKTHCLEATATAKEAVRRKFDILRTLLGAKEQEFLAVVDDAGRRRMDATTKLVCDATVATSETQGFVSHLETQLERLQAHRGLFIESRKSLLESSGSKLNILDDTITRLQLELDECRNISLGVAVPIEGIVLAIQSVHAPAAALPLGAHVEIAGIDGQGPVTQQQFHSAPGVKQWVSDGGSQPAEQPITPRRSFAKELEALRSTPLSLATANPAPATRPQSPIRSPLADGRGTPSGDAPSALITRAAQRTGTAMRTAFPPELEALKRQVAQRHQAGGSGPSTPRRQAPSSSGAALPVERQHSTFSAMSIGSQPPHRASSPASHRAATPTRGPGHGDNFPGPGAYYKVQPFNTRSVLSTPPRSSSSRR